MTADKFTYFECDNAYFRRRNALSDASIHDVLHGDRWVPYEGDCLRPAVFGDEVPDPAPDASDALSVRLTAEGRRNIVRTAELSEQALTATQHRILDAGGRLQVWAVLHEDTYETAFGDGLYLHIGGVALDEPSARRLAALGTAEGHPTDRWHVRECSLTLQDGMPFVDGSHTIADEWTINDFIRLIGEISGSQSASSLVLSDDRRLRLPDDRTLRLGS